MAGARLRAPAVPGAGPWSSRGARPRDKPRAPGSDQIPSGSVSLESLRRGGQMPSLDGPGPPATAGASLHSPRFKGVCPFVGMEPILMFL